ncbi:hypothetical protein FGRMN_9951 [Fusarium graminum]|nr:hypothetical protein FGRMN_9951 [Fusarium graminum]
MDHDRPLKRPLLSLLKPLVVRLLPDRKDGAMRGISPSASALPQPSAGPNSEASLPASNTACQAVTANFRGGETLSPLIKLEVGNPSSYFGEGSLLSQTLHFKVQFISEIILDLSMDPVSSNFETSLPDDDSSVSETSDDEDPLCNSVSHESLSMVTPITESGFQRNLWNTLRKAQAIVPLSALLTDATEIIAAKAGDTIGALLNITFGNLVELILLIALKNNQIYIVQASILGSVLVNLLLILGSALLASGVTDVDFMCNTAETQLLACLLFVSVFVVLMPTAFAQTFSSTDKNKTAALKMSRISALLVLLVYVLYFIHEIKSRSTKDNEAGTQDRDLENGSTISHPHVPLEHRSSSLTSQHPPSRTIRFAENHSRERRADSIYKLNDVAELDAIEPVDASDSMVDRGRRSGETSRTSFSRPNSYQPLLNSTRPSRSLSVTSSRGFQSRDSSMSREGRRTTAIHRLREHRVSMDQLVHHQPYDEKVEPDWKASVAMLIITSVLMSMCGEFLVSTIDDITHEGGLSEGLIGLVILPIVGNVAEYVTVVAVAIRGNLDLAIAVAVGSAIQIALCISPLTVMAGWAMQKNLDLTFNTFEMVTLAGTVLLVNLLILNDGSSNLKTSGLKGALMCACYVIFGLGAFLSP